MLPREDGPVIVYLFARSSPIAKEDRRVEFDPKVGRLEISQAFGADERVYQGKMEL